MSFVAKQLVNKATPAPVALPKDLSQLLFGTLFATNMIECDWKEKEGWGTPCVRNYDDVRLTPASGALHYGLQCFEGMKGYKDANGHLRLFRPEMNAKRMIGSCDRLALPTFDATEFIELNKELLKLNKEWVPWVPDQKGFSMYIRPTMVAANHTLRIAAPDMAKFFIIHSPCGPVCGFKPISLWATAHAVRAWPGGAGAFKIGGNYAPTIKPSLEAVKRGYEQILWLGPDHAVEEVGFMNFFMLWKTTEGDTELITAPLDGTILPGVTRDSVLTMCREWGEFKVSERTFTMDEVVRAHKEGRIKEMFGCGTAAIITAVNHVNYDDYDMVIPCPEKGSLAVRLLDGIEAIQYGEVEHPWSVVID
jgi:branched-chain amino acid aminotransferase